MNGVEKQIGTSEKRIAEIQEETKGIENVCVCFNLLVCGNNAFVLIFNLQNIIILQFNPLTLYPLSLFLV